MNLTEALERRAARGPHMDLDSAITAALTTRSRVLQSGIADSAADHSRLAGVSDDARHEVHVRPDVREPSRTVWWGLAAAFAAALGVGIAVVRDTDNPQPATSLSPGSTGAGSTPDTSSSARLLGPAWSSDQQMIVYVSAQATPVQVDIIRQALLATGHIDPARLEYLNAQASLAEARTMLAADPAAIALLTPSNIPTEFKAFALAGHYDLLRALKRELLRLPLVQAVRFPTDALAWLLAERVQWTPTVGMVVYVSAGASGAAIDAIRHALLNDPASIEAEQLTYLDVTAAITDAAAILALDPESSAALTAQITPTVFKVATIDVADGDLDRLIQSLYELPDVAAVRFHGDQGQTDETASASSITTG